MTSENPFELFGNLPSPEDPRFLAMVQRIEQMLAVNPEMLFSMLYRLDVSEQALKKAMHPAATTAPAESIALLIINRQLQRQQTKAKYRTSESWEWPD